MVTADPGRIRFFPAPAPAGLLGQTRDPAVFDPGRRRTGWFRDRGWRHSPARRPIQHRLFVRQSTLSWPGCREVCRFHPLEPVSRSMANFPHRGEPACAAVLGRRDARYQRRPIHSALPHGRRLPLHLLPLRGSLAVNLTGAFSNSPQLCPTICSALK
ncbi:hypothetical protein D3C86_1701670 [compost metagenome]